MFRLLFRSSSGKFHKTLIKLLQYILPNMDPYCSNFVVVAISEYILKKCKQYSQVKEK
jgi:hypothetical protein